MFNSFTKGIIVKIVYANVNKRRLCLIQTLLFFLKKIVEGTFGHNAIDYTSNVYFSILSHRIGYDFFIMIYGF